MAVQSTSDGQAGKPVTGGPVRVGDLIAHGKLMWGYCRCCGRERDLDPAALPVSADVPVPEVGKRMVCSTCGGRTITTAPELYPGGIAAMRQRYR